MKEEKKIEEKKIIKSNRNILIKYVNKNRELIQIINSLFSTYDKKKAT